MENLKFAVFRKTRGGSFNNGGYRQFFGFFYYDDFVNYLLCYHDMFDHNRNEKGRFCKTYFTDANGNKIANYGDLLFDFDGDFDRFELTPIEYLDSDEKYIIFRDAKCYEIEEELLRTVYKEELQEIYDRMKEWKEVFSRIVEINCWKRDEF